MPKPQQLERLERLREVGRSAGLDAILVVPGPTFRYLTGAEFKMLERPKVLFVPMDGEPVMVLPFLEASRYQGLGMPGELITWRDETGYTEAFTRAASLLSLKRVGVEGLTLRFQEFAATRAAFPAAEFIDVQPQTIRLRAHKDASEVELIRRAIAYSEGALEKTFAAARVGMTETEVQAILFNALLEYPIRDISEGVCVAGKFTAQPHGKARTNYRLQRGDALLIDFAIRAEGYYADITRTVFLETVSDEDRAFYNVVLEANTLGRELVRPGALGNEIDDAVLGYMEKAGYGQFIIHKVGHGIGLDVHEPPMIMRGHPVELEVGNVITIEPGLYDTSRLGVRIEDDLLVTPGGAETLTTFPRELMIVG